MYLFVTIPRIVHVCVYTHVTQNLWPMTADRPTHDDEQTDVTAIDAKTDSRNATLAVS